MKKIIMAMLFCCLIMISSTHAAGYTLTVNGFSRTGVAANREITLKAVDKEGQGFYCWEVISGEVVLDNPSSMQTTFKMPAGDVNIRTSYVGEVTLTVEPGSLTYVGSYNKTRLITAQDQTTYTITYNYNGNGKGNSQVTSNKLFANWTLTGGGSISSNTTSTTTYTYGTSDATLTASYSTESVILPTPTFSGYTFGGWYTEPSGGTKVGNGGDSYTPSESINLYAMWNTNDYTLTLEPGGATYSQAYNSKKTIDAPIQTPYIVTYNYNGSGDNDESVEVARLFNSWLLTGGGALDSITANPVMYTYGTSDATLTAEYVATTVTLPRPTRAGYTFNGWYTLPTNGTKIGNGGDNYTPSGDITLYAQWKVNNYTLTLQPGGTTYSQAYNSTKAISAPILDAYKITYDYNGSGEEDTVVEATRAFNGWALSGGGSIDSTTNNPTTYTYGASNGILTASYLVSDIILPEAIRTGYTFNGWYTEAIGGTKVGEANETYTPTEDIVLYAQWDIDSYTLTVEPGNSTYVQNYSTVKSIVAPIQTPYTIKYQYNNGSGATTISADRKFNSWTLTGGGNISSTTESTTLYTFGTSNAVLTADYSTSSVILPKPKKPGYTFNGWYTAESGGTKVGDADEGYVPLGDTVLYAQWSVNGYTLTVEPGGATYTQDYDTTLSITAPTQTYSVTYNYNGSGEADFAVIAERAFDSWTLNGSGSINSAISSTTTYRFGSSDAVLIANYENGNVILPDASRELHEFVGWYTAPLGGIKVGNAGENYTVTSDVTLYAQWNDVLRLNVVSTGLIADDGETYLLGVGESVQLTVSKNFETGDVLEWSVFGDATLSSTTGNTVILTAGTTPSTSLLVTVTSGTTTKTINFLVWNWKYTGAVGSKWNVYSDYACITKKGVLEITQPGGAWYIVIPSAREIAAGASIGARAVNDAGAPISIDAQHVSDYNTTSGMTYWSQP